MAGYSGKPLATKLGIKVGMVLRAIDAPADYRRLLAPLPDGARIVSGAAASRLKPVVRKEFRGENRS